MSAKIFIYGTLKRKFYNHHIMKSINATYLGDVITTNKHHLVVDKRYSPYILPNIVSVTIQALKPSFIHGELYKVDSEGLRILNSFEQTPLSRTLSNILVTSYCGGVERSLCVRTFKISKNRVGEFKPTNSITKQYSFDEHINKYEPREKINPAKKYQCLILPQYSVLSLRHFMLM